MIAIMSWIESLLANCPPPDPQGVVSIARGDALFHQDDAVRGLFVVTSGMVRLMRWTLAGQAIAIQSVRASSPVAEGSIFAETYHCDAVAAEDSRLLFIPKAVVLEALDRVPGLERSLTQALAKALIDARWRLELRSMTPLSDRLLAGMSVHADADGNLPSPVTIKSISEEIAATPTACYRALAALERAGKVERTSRGRVRIVRGLDSRARR